MCTGQSDAILHPDVEASAKSRSPEMKRLWKSIAFFAIANIIALIAPAYATVDGPGCAVVLKTPDGFLNLRKAPAANAAVVAKLRPGDRLYVDVCQAGESFEVCSENGWAQIAGVWRLDGNNFSKQWHFHAGWASARFLQDIKCPAEMERE
jgi:hypothetical protein